MTNKTTRVLGAFETQEEAASEINNKWYIDVIKGGCECQICFFFIQQEYTKYIKSIPFQPELSLERLY